MVFNVLLDIFVFAKVPGIDCNIILKKKKRCIYIYTHSNIFIFIWNDANISRFNEKKLEICNVFFI